MKLDAIDLRILTTLQQDGRISNLDLAETVFLSPSSCLRRVRMLEDTTDRQIMFALIDGLLRHALEDVKRDAGIVPRQLAATLYMDIAKAVRQKFKVKESAVLAEGLAEGVLRRRGCAAGEDSAEQPCGLTASPVSLFEPFFGVRLDSHTFKAALTDLAVAKLGPIGAEMKRLLHDPAAIDAVLADGAERARKLARQTMNAVKDVVGFVH